jgi:hypothetical protein
VFAAILDLKLYSLHGFTLSSSIKPFGGYKYNFATPLVIPNICIGTNIVSALYLCLVLQPAFNLKHIPWEVRVLGCLNLSARSLTLDRRPSSYVPVGTLGVSVL